MRKLLLLVGISLVLVLAMMGPALAHFVKVTTPSGQTNCQFLGGPGNPAHQGHGHGHVKAIAHEGSSTVTIGTC